MTTRSGSRRAWTRRVLSLLLAAVMMLGYLPGFPGANNAEAHWAEPYLNQLVEWGFIRADQANNPNMALTRADFMAIVNRAYGYKTPGETPFEDVEPNKWYYDDVGIAYNARYIVGTSPTTASPNNPLTRETATTILGRNMMLQESPGEILDFTDARQISNWAMGTVKSSLEHYIVNGYVDGTFRPKRNVSWGEMATMITKLIGTPLQEPGDYSLGGVFGNVTITSSNVTLRDSVVGGDVYVTGGVGLGNVRLENVNVLGRIIASGTGRSEGGEASILLRNVTADELLIDNLQDDYVSVQADGITEINRTTVRTSAYIEDNTPDGLGLKYISIEGDSYPEGEEPDGWEPIQVDLAGRIGEVVNRTPKSQVRVGKGTVEKLTVDEAATDSTVIIDRGAVVKELNLDTATYVTGEGDIGHLIVNAPGCVIDILPDQITIRPGITAIIAGEEMDSVAAEEFSMNPLILAGYPEARDITPTGLEGVFMTNKAGTVYYGVSAITDGSIGEDDLIKPPSYGSIAVAGGSVKVAKGNEETVAAITGLTPGGSYYLSAVLVDAKGNRSPVKVISFTTPDNTVPAFCDGYPYMASVGTGRYPTPDDPVKPGVSQVAVMPNKDCKLYYALLPKGAVAPTEDEFRTNAVSGALGYGVRDVYKNVESIFRVHDQILEEKTTYVLYLWLTDANYANKGKIVSLTFTTSDETGPFFVVEPTVTKVDKTSVTMTFTLNEDGTVYWVAIPANTMKYPKPEPGTGFETAPPTSLYGMLQIENGMNIGADGKSGRVNCKGNTPGTITVSGLKPETAYEFYYMAKDTAGNYTAEWKMIQISPLDESGPKFTQSFSKSSSLDNKSDPLSNTDIYLDVTEDVRYSGQGGGTSFLELYKAVKDARTKTEEYAARNKLAESLYNTIKLHKINLYDNSEETISSKWQVNADNDNNNGSWTIDYTQARVESHEGGIRITFPSSGLHLENGGEYYFTITNITDVSNNQNPIVPSIVDFYTNEALSKGGGHDVPVFFVEFARVDFSTPGVGAGDGPLVDRKGTITGGPENEGYEDQFVRTDLTFRMTPISTDTVSDQISYDLLLWTDRVLEYDLYYRVVDPYGDTIMVNGAYPATASYEDRNTQETVTATNYLMPRLGGRDNDPDANGWILLGNSGAVNADGYRTGRSVNKKFNGCGMTSFPKLKNLSPNLRYEFVIHLTSLEDISEAGDGWRTWNGEVKFYANVAAGQSSNLENLSGSVEGRNGQKNWEDAKKKGLNGGVLSIGRNNTNTEPRDTQELSRLFTDSRLPHFESYAPTFDPSATSVDVKLQFSTEGTLYYLVGKAKTGANGTPEIITTRKLLRPYAPNEEGNLTTNTAKPGNLLPVVGAADTAYIRIDDVAEDNATRIAPPENGVSMPPWMVGGVADDPAARNDDPSKDNLIISPRKQFVFNPKGSADTASAISGNFPFRGRIEETLTIEKLSPDTDYFIYFVIKGESDELSHVYIYQFKTPKATKPKITANNYIPNDDSHAGAAISTDIDSQLQYYVFTLADAEDKAGIPLLQTLIEVSEAYATAHSSDIVTTTPGTGEILSRNGKYYVTALTALVTKYRGEDSDKSDTDYGFSLFDIYAEKPMKTEMSNFLHGGFAGYLMGTVQPVDQSNGEIDMKGGVTKNETLLHTDPGTDYVILAVAHVPNPNSTDRAEYETYGGFTPIRAGRAKGPVVTDWFGSLNMGKKSDQQFTGTIYVDFAPQLYFANDRKTKLDNSNIARLPMTANNKGNVNVTVSTSNSQQTTLQFDGTWRRNDHIEIPCSNLFNANGIAGTGKLVIDVVEAPDGTGMQIKIKWDPGKAEQVFFFPFQETNTPVTIYYNLNTGVPANAGCSLEGNPGNQTLIIPGEKVGQDVRITGTVTPNDMLSYTYSWSLQGDGNVVSLSNFASNQNLASATLSVKGPGTTTVRLRVSGTNKEQREVNEYCDLKVIVTGISLKGITTSVGRIESGAIYWDLSKGSSATLTLSSTAALEGVTTNDVSFGAGTSISISDPSGIRFENGRTEVSIPVHISGTPPTTAPRMETLVVTVKGLKCTIPVYYEGSQSNLSNIPGGANLVSNPFGRS